MRATVLSCTLKPCPERMDAMLSKTGEGHDWSRSTGRTAASNLLAAARAFSANPIPAPPRE